MGLLEGKWFCAEIEVGIHYALSDSFFTAEAELTEPEPGRIWQATRTSKASQSIERYSLETLKPCSVLPIW